MIVGMLEEDKNRTHLEDVMTPRHYVHAIIKLKSFLAKVNCGGCPMIAIANRNE